MIKTVVESTTIRTVFYDPERKFLQLEFCNGRIYQYLDVPAEIHEGLLAAFSKGRYFNEFIRDEFAYTKIKTASFG